MDNTQKKVNIETAEQPLVSIIVRTCNRPSVLKTALNSIRKQTYQNIEIIVVEDGPNKSEHMIDTEYGDLNIKYYCMQDKVGRTKTGNFGLEKASGKYYNFLDDDDAFYPNHVEKLVQELEIGTNKAAYSIAEESQIVVKSQDPYTFREKRRIVRYAQPFNRILLYHSNYIPIQSIMFQRDLYEQLGGFDEHLEVLEDWDVWARYSTMTDFTFVPEKTSVYYVPSVRRNKKKRASNLYYAEEALRNKFQQYQVTMNVGQVYQDMEYVIKKYKTGQLVRYLRLAWNFLLYGEK